MRGSRAALLAAAVLAADQFTKYLAVSNIRLDQLVHLMPGLTLSHTRNRGVAFGLLSGHPAAVLALVLVALAGLVAWYVRHLDSAWVWLSTGLLIGGAAGNIADRIRLGYVRDFIDPAWWPAFNIADAAITIGVVLLLISIEVGERTDGR